MADTDEDLLALEAPRLDRPSLDALPAANALRRGVSRLARRLRSLRSDEEIAGAKLSLLARLHRAGRPMIAADIARAERLKPQSLTRIIAELDALGFIRREHDSFDHRQVLIDIAPRGSRHLALHAIRQNAWLAQAIATSLTPAEREMLRIASELMDKLADAEVFGETGEEGGARNEP